MSDQTPDPQQTTAAALIEAGFEPRSVRDAIAAADLTRLRHTGKYSVQLPPPPAT